MVTYLSFCLAAYHEAQWDADAFGRESTMQGIKALTFDTGGTILDWHTGISAALAEAGGRHGLERD